MASTGLGEAPPSAPRGGRTKTKSVRRLLEPLSPVPPSQGTKSKKLASQRASGSISASPTPAASAIGSSMPSEPATPNAGASSSKKNSKAVGSIVSDLEVEALSTVMANKLRLRYEDENLWNEGLDWNAGIQMEIEPEEEQGMDSDPDIMNDADEL
ncbi:unnamed protein product [Urochloa decumbens]|uniref:Uncharacterized protein n=1 Tax=Urochloa decumbens TaxID=240449 RepID=A0ABC8ZC42_9POAL